MLEAFRRLSIPILMASALAGCHPFTISAVAPVQYTEQAMASAPRITVEDVQQRLAKKEKVLIVDVRAPEAYQQEHITDSQNLPRVAIAMNTPNLPKDTLIVLYCTCHAEHSAAAAALDLKKQGYTNVTALLGGLMDWKAKGYPTETSALSTVPTF